nr:glycosyltransferase [Candidatus Levybacteria bacterium]
MEETPELVQNPELEAVKSSVVVASSTFYKNWYPGELKSLTDIDKLRGDLAIEALGKTATNGYRVIDVDGGSSPDFLQALNSTGAEVINQQEPGYSASRRQGNALAAEKNPKAIFSVEPEKPSLMDSIPALAEPILEGNADIVFASRNQAAFDTYPPVQAEFEQKSNKLANDILREHGLLPQDSPDLDWWMGARMIRNDPEVLGLFQEKYDFRKFNSAIDNTINLELWPNSLYIPVIAALAKGLKVVSVPVNYVHPEIQTKSETGVQAFGRKREIQFKGIIIAMIEEVRRIELESGKSSKPSRLVK